MHVQIIQVDEADNSLIISEREAWVSIQVCLFPFSFPSFTRVSGVFGSGCSLLSFEVPAM